jgi:EAL domain-containing protein (putative c-di-GMP-specific phosphodiesterase class I)
MVLPGEFIPIAEDTGLIVPIGQWVLEESCRNGAAWRDLTGRPIRICVNLSARQFEHPRLLIDVNRALEAAGLDPSALTLEITESVVMKDPAAAANKLREIKALGVRVALDDFGTGYSSLAYLRSFPIDSLKVDRSFIHGLGDDHDATAIVRSVIALGHALNLIVVAEGIETDDQRDQLRDLKCDLGQGYLFARPASAEDLRPLLATASQLTGSPRVA